MPAKKTTELFAFVVFFIAKKLDKVLPRYYNDTELWGKVRFLTGGNSPRTADRLPSE